MDCCGWMSVLICVLSILVTVLMGWQIYSIIDVNKMVEEMKANTNIVQEETMARAYTSIMNQTAYIVEGRTDNDDCYNAIANGLFACKHYHLAQNNNECIKLLNMIASFKKEHCKLNKTQIKNLWQIIGQLKGLRIDTSIVETWLNEYEPK